MPSTQPSDDNTALIGGVVGGVVALFLIIGLIAFIVSRNRRKVANKQDQPSNRNDVSMAPAQASSSNYGKINVQPASNHYDESFFVLANNNYGIVANANQTNYDDPSVLSH
jgi:predicted lipid-binding transport protein (Tim44 family)